MAPSKRSRRQRKQRQKSQDLQTRRQQQSLPLEYQRNTKTVEPVPLAHTRFMRSMILSGWIQQAAVIVLFILLLAVPETITLWFTHWWPAVAMWIVGGVMLWLLFLRFMYRQLDRSIVALSIIVPVVWIAIPLLLVTLSAMGVWIVRSIVLGMALWWVGLLATGRRS